MMFHNYDHKYIRPDARFVFSRPGFCGSYDSRLTTVLGVFMYSVNDVIAVGSNPDFRCSFSIGDSVYIPELVYYQVQAKKVDSTEWENVGDVQTLRPNTTEWHLILTSSDTSSVDGCTLDRRIVLQLFRKDSGAVLNETSVIEFSLSELPVLVPETPVTEPFALVSSESVDSDIDGIIKLSLSFNYPVASFSSVLLSGISEVFLADSNTYVILFSSSVETFEYTVTSLSGDSYSGVWTIGE